MTYRILKLLAALQLLVGWWLPPDVAVAQQPQQVVPCTPQPSPSGFNTICVNQGTPASGAAGYPPASTPVEGLFNGSTSSGTILFTLPAAPGKFTYLCGFSVFSSGETMPAIRLVGITASSSLTYAMNLPAVAAGTSLFSLMPPPFTPCLIGGGVNTAVSISIGGAAANGNTFTYGNAWGYQQ
jgi:hypothetical protein